MLAASPKRNHTRARYYITNGETVNGKPILWAGCHYEGRAVVDEWVQDTSQAWTSVQSVVDRTAMEVKQRHPKAKKISLTQKHSFHAPRYDRY